MPTAVYRMTIEQNTAGTGDVTIKVMNLIVEQVAN